MEFDVVIEIPKGQRNKYEMDHETGRIRLDRMLFTATRYPSDYGFVEDTLADDGDPLDVLVLVDEPSFPGCLIEVRPIGVLEMIDQGVKDEKVLAVARSNPRYEGVHNYTQIYPHIMKEISHFFSVYKDLEGKRTQMLGWKDATAARAAIIESAKRFRETMVEKEAAVVRE